MDSSTYVSNQQSMITLPSNITNQHDISVTYGPLLFETLAQLGDNIGGAQWLVGLSLININNVNATVATAVNATSILGNRVDAFLLGNVCNLIYTLYVCHDSHIRTNQEPDLYLSHQERTGIANYTTGNYVRHTVHIRVSNSGVADVNFPFLHRSASSVTCLGLYAMRLVALCKMFQSAVLQSVASGYALPSISPEK
jgi:hypothetical protein